jgi:Flp pilus assembly protein TadD
VKPALLSALLAVLLYAGTIDHDFTFDDVAVVRENRDLEPARWSRLLTRPWWGPEGKDPLFRPVTMLSLGLNRALTGRGPAGFHAGNVLLHALASALAAAYARTLLGRPGLALAVGLLFAAHPVHTEAVAGIVGRAESLAAIFALLMLRALRSPRPLHRFAGAPLCFLLALGSKESAIAALPLAALAELAFPTGGTRAARLGRLLPLLLPAALFFAARVVLFGAPLREGPSPVWAEFPAAVRVLTAFKVTALYLRLLFWPWPLSPDYSWDAIPAARSFLEPGVLAGVALPIALVAVPAALRSRAGVFAALFTLIALAPVSNLFYGMGTVAAERLLYLPSWGAVLLAAVALRRWPWAIGGLVLAAGIVTLVRCRDWRDDYTLFERAVRTTPRSYVVQLKRGVELERRGESAAAESHLREALRIRPGIVEALNALAGIRFRAGEAAEAEKLFREAIRLRPADPIPRKGLGGLLAETGRAAEAEAELREALRLDPGFADAWSDLGTVRARAGDLAGARAAFDEALRFRPDLSDALRGRAGARRMLGDLAGAEADLRTALRRDPGDHVAAWHLGDLLGQAGRKEEAVAVLEAALGWKPEGPSAAQVRALLERLR